jgi:hypothetical protein
MTRATTFRAAAIFSGFLIAILMVMSVSRAMFTNPTSNDDNSWTSGEVVLVNGGNTTDGGPGASPPYDETGSALFTITDMAPGDSDTFCLEVIYQGNLDADILLDSVTITGLDENSISAEMNLTIDRWDTTGCTGSSATVASGTLASPGITETAWQPASPGTDESRWYEITVELDTNAANDMQNRTIDGVEFEWLATNN